MDLAGAAAEPGAHHRSVRLIRARQCGAIHRRVFGRITGAGMRAPDAGRDGRPRGGILDYVVSSTGRIKSSVIDMVLMYEPAEAYGLSTYRRFGDKRAEFAADIATLAPLLVEERGLVHARRIARRTAFTRGLKDDQGPFGTHAAFRYHGDGADQPVARLGPPEPLRVLGASSVGGDRVGTRRGDAFLINPSQATDAALNVKIDSLLRDRLDVLARMALATSRSVDRGVPLAVAREATMRLDPDALGANRGEAVEMPLYVHADLRVMSDDAVDVLTMNVPDVGLFYSELDTAGNECARKVKEAVRQVVAELTAGFRGRLAGRRCVTIVTRDSVIAGADVLERKEIAALSRMLRGLGVGDVTVVGQSTAVNHASRDALMLLLNTDTDHASFAPLAERIIRSRTRCYPNPAVQVHADVATTYRTAVLSGARFDSFYALVNPNKEISVRNCERVHNEILRRLDQGGVTAELFYVHVPGQISPLACTRTDLRSLFEIRKQIDKQRARGGSVTSITFKNVPYDPSKSLVAGPSGRARVASFRCVAYRHAS
jgi:hypothetical protein